MFIWLPCGWSCPCRRSPGARGSRRSQSRGPERENTTRVKYSQISRPRVSAPNILSTLNTVKQMQIPYEYIGQ